MFSRGILAAPNGLTLLLLLLTGATPRAEQKGLQTIRLIRFVPAHVAAQARGYFAAAGLNIEVTNTPNSTVQMRGLSEGAWDIADTAFDNVLAWSGREGATIVAVLQRGAQVDLPVYVRGEIGEWSDLRGTLAWQPGRPPSRAHRCVATRAA